MHEHLLVRCDRFFLQLSAARRVAHELGQVLLRRAVLEELLADRTEPSEFAQIVARYGLNLIETGLVVHFIWRRFEDVDKDVYKLEVLRVVEEDEACLPELLRVDGRPRQLTPLHLCLPLVERAELLVILVEVREELLQDSFDLSVDPRAIAKFNDEV